MATTHLPPLPDVQRLSPRVIRILGGNPGKCRKGTNTYLVGRGPRRVLIDTGQGEPSWSKALGDVLKSEGCSVSRCLLTHWHQDHVRGVPDLLALQRSAAIHKNRPREMSTDSESWLEITDGERFVVDEAKDEVNGTTLRAIYSPGHTVDHMSFVLEEEGSLFTGDNVLGHGTAVFEDLGAYMRSLEVMWSAEHFTGKAYPGHGDVLQDGKATLREYIEHRGERERQILDVLRSDKARDWGSMDIVKVVYKDVNPELHGYAEGGVKLVLKKLAGDGTVEAKGGQGDEKWRLLDGPRM